MLWHTILVSLSAATLAQAATTTAASASASACNPLSSSCSPDKALATDISVDFTSSLDYFDEVSTESGISYGDDGLTMTLAKRFDNPAIKSTIYIMFGRVECQFKAAKGKGIVSSFYLQSDDLDEIDLEWLGGDDTQFQTNFFSKGNTTTYTRGEYQNVDSAPQDDFHNYTIVWTEEELVWYYDGSPVRTLKNTTSSGYPQTPMYIKAGIWAGGDPSNDQGTIEWAGGETDYSDAPFKMYIKDISVSDYSTGKEYSYSDKSGSWTSIKAKDGEVNGRMGKAEEVSNEAHSSATTSASSKSEDASSATETDVTSGSTAPISTQAESEVSSTALSTSLSTTPYTSSSATPPTSTPTTSSSSTTSSASSAPSVATSANSGAINGYSILYFVLAYFATF